MHAYMYYSYGSIFGDLNFINTLLAKCIVKFRLAGFDPKILASIFTRTASFRCFSIYAICSEEYADPAYCMLTHEK